MQDKENKTEVVHLRLEPSKLSEAKYLAEKAGYGDVSQFLRVCLFDRAKVEAFKAAKAKAMVEEMREWGIGLAYLREAGLEE